MNIVEEDKVIGGDKSSKTNKKWSKFEKWKNLAILSNIKAIRFLTFEASISFFY